MIFKPKISHQKPIKPPLKADFNAYFTKKRMIFTPIYKICATPKGPFRVRFPAGVPNKKEPSGSFLFGFRCGNGPAVRPIAQQWHEERSDEVFPAGTPKRPRDGKPPGLFSWYQLIQSFHRNALRIGHKVTVNLQCDRRIAVSHVFAHRLYRHVLRQKQAAIGMP